MEGLKGLRPFSSYQLNYYKFFVIKFSAMFASEPAFKLSYEPYYGSSLAATAIFPLENSMAIYFITDDPVEVLISAFTKYALILRISSMGTRILCP